MRHKIIIHIMSNNDTDEGKGAWVARICDMIPNCIVARFNGGSNAGHTIYTTNGEKIVLHLIPSGIANKNHLNLIGNGCVVNKIKFIGELQNLYDNGIDYKDRLFISSFAHVVSDEHLRRDQDKRLKDGIGTTGK